MEANLKNNILVKDAFVQELSNSEMLPSDETIELNNIKNDIVLIQFKLVNKKS